MNTPSQQSVHQRVQAWAERAGSALALIDGERHVSYAELDQRANQLARYLRQRGVGPEVRVGLCLERSTDLVISLLAILKAGGAYVPLDPAYPAQRLAYLMDDAGAALYITHEHHAALFAGQAAPVIQLDSAWAAIAAESSASLAGATHPDQLAYVIYTSGSTGQPKGVLVQHSALANYIQAILGVFDLQPRDRLLQFASLNFDTSAEEIFAPLAAGATLVLRDDAMLGSTELFLRTCAEWGITVLDLPTAYWHLLAADLADSAGSLPPAIRLVVIGGEEASAEHVRRWQRYAGGVALINAYGPTEATISATVGAIPALGSHAASVPLGRPLEHLGVYILDPAGQPAPPGGEGEIYIGGAGVARGYLGRPELTAERFLPDPLSPIPGARMYRTGDAGSYTRDGLLEYRGRLDQQVKVRGFRIELGEVEAAINALPEVRQAVAVVRADEAQAGGAPVRRLAAYVVLHDGAPAGRDLRERLKERLPEYMVPSVIYAVDALPLMPNGKLDRAALGGLAGRVLGRPTGTMAPRSPTELALAAIWGAVLDLPAVGIDAEFGDLGGHSLHAMQIVARIRQAFQVDVPIADFFGPLTIERLAAALAGAQGQAAVAPIERADRDHHAALSASQRRLWFLDQLEPGNPAYHIPLAYRLRGALDSALLERSLSAVIRRHEALRSSFPTVDGVPYQRIDPWEFRPLPLIDLSDLPEALREARLAELLHTAAHAPFDLSQGPLLRQQIFRLAPDEHVVGLVFHHIIFDGWSEGVFLREWAAFYTALLSGGADGGAEPAAEPALQYRDFSAWQAQWAASAEHERQVGYWKQQLRDLAPALALPTAPGAAATSARPRGRCLIELSPRLARRLNDLSRKQGGTLFMTLLAAFQTLLYRYTGQRDIAVVAPIAHRTHPDTEGMIGFFVNLLILRSSIDGRASFSEIVRQVRDTTVAAYANQDVAFDVLVRELNLERAVAEQGFQTAFILQNIAQPASLFPGLTLAPLKVELDVAQFDLALELNQAEGGLSGWFEYNEQAFEHVTIERLTGHFLALLEQIAADPELPVADLALLSPAERALIFDVWNNTATDYEPQPFHALFERQAASTPAAIAVAMDARQLSYRDLNERANQLAHHLRSCGVGAEDRVGIFLERSPEVLIAMMAIWKAGAAYLPLDPAYPDERLAFMCQDAAVTAVITLQGLAGRLGPAAGRLIALDGERGLIERQPATNPALGGIGGDNLAYIIYTSGSTGVPKGVEVTHRGLGNLAAHQIEAFEIDSASRVLQVASYNFDVSVADIVTALLAGATLCLAPAEAILPGPAMIRTMQRERVTAMALSVAVMAGLPEADLPDLRAITVGGDVCPPHLVSRWGRNRLFFNAYGPTEATVCVATTPCAADGVAPPIGRPIANITLYILDELLRPAPIGAIGEIFIGGVGVARGYANRPDLTAERFVPDPFSQQPGARLYRSGDLARYLPDGRMTFLGRTDQQVKMRGFRIEPGEIETLLARQPGVHQATVLVEAINDGQTLSAYVVASAGEALDTSALRTALRRHLPEYMVPSLMTQVAAIPLTPNGKVDRRALAAQRREAQQETEETAARTAVEEVLAQIWAQTLDREQVGIHSNFFELGGHSLLATQVVAHICDLLQVELSIRTLFEHPTVAALAEALLSDPVERPRIERTADILIELAQLSEDDLDTVFDEPTL